jgi:hypothetical protein
VLKEPPPLPVSFVVQSTWQLADDAIIKYSIIKNQITPAANDWVGLYPVSQQVIRLVIQSNGSIGLAHSR